MLIADDQATVRSSLRRALTSEDGIEIVAEAADGPSAVDLARRLAPDVAVIDVRMPGFDGIEVTRRLVGTSGSGVRVVLLTTFDLDEYVYPALRAGASGFVLKRSGPALLVEAIRAAHSDEVLIGPSITVRLLERVGPVDVPRSTPEPQATLTPREIEVAELVARGLTNPEIATRLFVTAGTVKTHVAALQRKLGLPNRVRIAVWAWESGLAGGTGMAASPRR